MLEMNQRMAALEIGFEEALGDSSSLDGRLADILADGFEDGCIVLSVFAGSAPLRSDWARPGGVFDKTGLEAFVNHIHVEDEPPDAEAAEVRRQAALYVGRLRDELRRAYPTLAFVVVMAIGDSTLVRFHRDRPGQGWLADDLEGYETEAVLRLRI